MKKTIRFAVCGIDFSVSVLLVCLLGLCYGAGVIGTLFFSVEVSDKLFSPLFILSFDKGIFATFLHSFLYFFLFPILALAFGTSYFGFLLFPLAAFIKGIFSAMAVQELCVKGDYFTAFLVYGILIALEIGVLLVYYVQAMEFSLGFFRSRKEGAETVVFSDCLRQFAVVSLLMSILAVCCGVLQYFL